MNPTAFSFDPERFGPGTTLIEASAGTGKTFTIEGVVLHLVACQGLELRNLLAMTFTEAATKDLRRRIRERLKQGLDLLRSGQPQQLEPALEALADRSPEEQALAKEHLRVALETFDEARILTIHGFCSQILKEFALECGLPFELELLEPSQERLERMLRDFWAVHCQSLPRLLNRIALDELPSLAQHVLSLSNYLWIPIDGLEETDGLDALSQEIQGTLPRLSRAWAQEQEYWFSLAEPSCKEMNQPYRVAFAAALEALRDLEAAQEKETLPLALQAVAQCFNLNALRSAQAKRSTLTLEPTPLTEASEQLQRLLRQFPVLLLAEAVSFVRQRLARELTEHATAEYADLIEQVDQALEKPELRAQLADRFDLVLLDEFQDTDRVQWRIAQSLRKAGNRLFMVGDPKQAIYGFRGADLKTYLRAAKTADQHLSLPFNWRSEPPLVGAVNALHQISPLPFLDPQIAFHPVEARRPESRPLLHFGASKAPPPCVLRQVVSGKRADFAAVTARDIRRLLESGARLGDHPLEARDLVVIVQTHQQINLIREALKAQGLRSVTYSNQSVFRSGAAREIARLMAAVLQPRYPGLLNRVLLGPFFGQSYQDLLEREDGANGGVWVERLAQWKQHWELEGITALLQSILLIGGTGEALAGRPDGERWLTDFGHLVEWLHEVEQRRRLSPAAVLDWLESQRHDDHGPGADACKLRLESENNATKVITVHRSKGLEFPVVFLPFISQESTPRKGMTKESGAAHLPPEGELRYLLAGSADQAQRDVLRQERDAEEARLLYVAMTRAENQLYLYHPEQGIAEKSALGRLLGRREPQEAVETLSRLAETHPKYFAKALGDEPLSAPSGTGSELEQSAELSPASFTGQVDRSRMIASFSSLTESHEAPELPDRDASPPPVAPNPDRGELDDRELLPPGAETGLLLHDLLEKLDFTQTQDCAALIQQQGRRYGLKSEAASQWIMRMIRHLVATPLEQETFRFCLKQIIPAHRLNEAGFSLPLKRTSPASLRQLLGKAIPAQTDWSSLDFQVVEGYLKGYIDSIVRWQDRYFIIDWKSNWLGPSTTDYSPDAVAKAMHEHAYTLQYHLYTLALRRYLRQRLAAYEEAAHFGGVFYIFLRGFQAGPNPGALFFDRPTESQLDFLEEGLLR